jgi:dTDP-glucose 4,6-dehydratase
MRVLITGGAGFIGSHLVDRYLERGHEVVAVDNFITGSAANLERARASERFRFVEADVADEWERVAAAFTLGRTPDLILHFASPASPVDYSLRPIETMAVNSRGTENCLRAALAWRCRVLYASTSETYGDPLEHPQREEYWGNVNPVGPRSCYDESKRFGEALVMSYLRVHDLDVRIIRIFNTYGPRMRGDDGRVVPNFVTQALAGRPLTVYGDGSQTRSFCYVDDLVEGIARCAEVEAARGVVVNLGNPNEYPIAVFADIVCRIAGVPLTVDSRPMPVDDPGRRCPDISRARRLLGWEPVVTLEEGLTRTLRAFAEYAPTANS